MNKLDGSRHRMPQGSAWRALWAAALAWAMAGPASGAPAREAPGGVLGLWVDQEQAERQKLGIWIDACGELLCGRIVWMKKPQSRDGHLKRDRRNPDESMRERPICGLRILEGFKQVAQNIWGDGHIYNPNDGRTYSSTLTLQPDGKLEVRGFVMFSWLGKTVAWVRPRDARDNCAAGPR